MDKYAQHALNVGPNEVVTFSAEQLGAASSQHQFHNHSGEFVTATHGNRCSACRWQEVKLFKLLAGGYRVYTVGRTIIPGEKDFIKIRDTESAFEIIELLTVRNGKSSAFLPVPAARALAQAAQHDDDIRDAYINRATI